MEFHEKLQELRKQKGLTQEELALALYVSRTAVSKWESGRGYPNIESLKMIAKYFSVTIDALLSGDEILTLAEADHQQQKNFFQDLVFGLLDVSVALLFFLPFFGQQADGMMQAVSLFSLHGVMPYLITGYWVMAAVMILWGILILALQNWRQPTWLRSKQKISLFFNGVGVFLLIISRQPYAAALLFVFLAIKAFILIKKP